MMKVVAGLFGRTAGRSLALGVCLATFLAVPAVGQRTTLGMLDGLERGRWELRGRDPAGEVQHVCIGDARNLIQLRHPNNICQRLVVDDSDSEVTVQYTCPGRGFGRTHIRRETGSLVQIDTQGVAGGLPFASSMEGRRVGGCDRR